MAYKKPENTWTDLTKVTVVDRNENSQLRISAVCKDNDMENAYLSVREFAKYVKKDERAMGMTLENAVFRPTTNGVTMPMCGVEDMIKAITKVSKEADKVLTKAVINYKEGVPA